MKLLSLVVLMVLTTSLQATEETQKVVEAAKHVSGETKRVLRKIGRTTVDGTCILTKTEAECKKQQRAHKALNQKEKKEGVRGD